MYKITIENEEGEKWTSEHVLAYDYYCLEDAQAIANGHKFTTEEIKVLENRLDRFEHFPDGDELRWTVEDLIEERRK